MRRTVLGFSVRIDARNTLDEMRPLVERALGCTLSAANCYGNKSFTGEMLGMKIHLSGWRGLDRRETFQLHGVVDDPGFLDESAASADVGAIEVDISPAIIDLFAVREAGDWRIPSPAEIRAETEYGNEVELAFQAPTEAPQRESEDDD